MFADNGIVLSPRDVKKLFDMVDDKKDGCLNLDEFKLFSQHEEANKMFKRLIKNIRDDMANQESNTY